MFSKFICTIVYVSISLFLLNKIIFIHIYVMYGLPQWLSGCKESACSTGDTGLIPGSGRFPGVRKWHPTPGLLPAKCHGQRSLAGYSPWGHKTTQQLSMHARKYLYKFLFLICISLMTNNVEYAFVCVLLAICVSSSENYLLRSHAHFN